MNKKTGGSLVVETLERCGAEVLFGIPGVHNLGMYEPLQRSPLRHVSPRHEQGAGFMADGYARATGRPGVALVITGPGLTNILTPLGEAYADAVPLLVISSQIPRSRLGGRTGTLHELKNSTIMSSSVTKASYGITRGEEIPWILSRAYAQTLEGRPGPVHVEIPLDILEAPVSRWNEASLERALYPCDAEKKLPEKALLNRAAELLNRGKTAVLICGGGASGAASEVRKVAERLDAPVFTTVAGKGVLREDHPLSGGCRLHDPGVREMLERTEVVLVIGTELSPADLWEVPFPREPRVIRLDSDPGALSRNARAEVGLAGDAAACCAALLPLLKKKEAPGIRDNLASLRRNCTENLDRLTGMGKAFPRMQVMLEALRRGIPEEGMLFMDMTGPGYVGLSEYPAWAPKTYLHPAGFGTLGYALPAAVGAKIALPECPVCAFSGDGGLQFTLPELAVACEEELCLPLVIWNNRGYGEIRRNEALLGWEKPLAVHLYQPNFSALASAYGISGEVAETPEELEAALSRGWNRSAPSIIEILSPEELD